MTAFGSEDGRTQETAQTVGDGGGDEPRAAAATRRARPIEAVRPKGRYERTLPTLRTRISAATGDAAADPTTLRFVPDLFDRPYRRDWVLQAAAVFLVSLAVFLWVSNVRPGHRPDPAQIGQHAAAVLATALVAAGVVVAAALLRQRYRTPETWRDKKDHGIEPLFEDEDVLALYPLPEAIDTAPVLQGSTRYRGGPVSVSRERHERYLAWSTEGSARTWALSPDLGAESWWDVPVDFREEPVVVPVPSQGDEDQVAEQRGERWAVRLRNRTRRPPTTEEEPEAEQSTSPVGASRRARWTARRRGAGASAAPADLDLPAVDLGAGPEVDPGADRGAAPGPEGPAARVRTARRERRAAPRLRWRARVPRKRNDPTTTPTHQEPDATHS